MMTSLSKKLGNRPRSMHEAAISGQKTSLEAYQSDPGAISVQPKPLIRLSRRSATSVSSYAIGGVRYHVPLWKSRVT